MAGPSGTGGAGTTSARRRDLDASTRDRSPAGVGRGNLPVGLAEGQYCNDSGRLPDQDDIQWHAYVLTWIPSRILATIDGNTWIDGDSGGAHGGNDIYLELGSECASGDETNAIYRSLAVCRDERVKQCSPICKRLQSAPPQDQA